MIPAPHMVRLRLMHAVHKARRWKPRTKGLVLYAYTMDTVHDLAERTVTLSTKSVEHLARTSVHSYRRDGLIDLRCTKRSAIAKSSDSMFCSPEVAGSCMVAYSRAQHRFGNVACTRRTRIRRSTSTHWCTVSMYQRFVTDT